MIADAGADLVGRALEAAPDGETVRVELVTNSAASWASGYVAGMFAQARNIGWHSYPAGDGPERPEIVAP